MSELKCPICGEILQKYGEVDSDTGTSIVLGASCCKCGIEDSDIKLWQALIDTKKKLDIAIDGFAEQRKWIGKLCWFWDNHHYEEGKFALLNTIDESSKTGYYFQTDGYDCWQNCKPVLPDDDRIYKGEE